MRLALDMGPNLGSGWAQERRWHGPAAAIMVHLAVALLWLAWPAPPPPVVDEQVIELVLAPQAQPQAQAEPQPPAAQAATPAAVKPMPVKPMPVKPAPAPKAAPMASTPAAAPAATMEAPAPAVPAAPQVQSEPDLKPNPTEAPRPFYPRAARQRGWQGVVTVMVRVAEDGQPLEVAVKESSGHTVLDEAALDAVKRWRFSPARQGGRAVTAAVEVPVRFSLEG